MANNELI